MSAQAETPDSGAPPSAAEMNHANRWPITICVMAATTMVFLDQTIANVALPHIQGSVSASQDQITWVLTSYIVAAALALPLTGWLSARFGVRTVLIASVAVFTLASALCGLATSLPEIVLFRVAQGASGAALMPLSQAILFDVHDEQSRAQAMSVWSMATLAAPMLGPLLGGWLTENWSWRWVFYVNVPIGIVCVLGLITFLARAPTRHRPFDGAGYVLLLCFIGGMQLMLDRGQSKGWFDAPEVWAELGLAALGAYLFAIHTVTTRNPFFHPSIMSNRTLLSASCMGAIITAVVMSSMALQPLMVQRLLGYSVMQAGLIAAPRGAGLMLSMQLATYLLPRIGPRALIAMGMIVSGAAQLMMSQFSLQMDYMPLVISNVVAGMGGPLVFMPISMMAMGNVEPELRTEAATMFNLLRNIGSSLGIAIVSALQVRAAQAAHARLVEHVRPDNPVIGAYMPNALDTPAGVGQVDAMVTAQAEMVSYVEVFALLGAVSLMCLPLLLMMKAQVLAPVRREEAESLLD